MRKLYLDMNLQLVFGVTLMVVLSVSSIMPALPLMIKEVPGLTAASIGLVITSFTLPGVFLTPVAGILGDRIGRKKILVPSLFLFGLAGAACFFSKDLQSLLILRFLQGVGAAPLGVLNMTLIGDLYRDRERVAAMGYNASVLSMGTAIFPAIGGSLALLGWQWPFLLPVVSIPLGLVVLLRLDNPEPKSGQNFMDYIKSALGQMKSRQALALFASTLLTFVILYGPMITYLPVLMDKRFGSSPVAIGGIFSAASFVTALAASQLGKLSKRFGEAHLLRAAFAIYIPSMLLLPLAPDFWFCALPIVLFGLAQGLNIPSAMTLLAGLAPMESRGAFMAANGMVLRLAQTIAPLLMGGVFALWGMNAVFVIGALCSMVMLALAIWAIK